MVIYYRYKSVSLKVLLYWRKDGLKMTERTNVEIFKSDFAVPFTPAVDMAALLAFLPKSQNNNLIFPGFCDVHVHFREPGFSY